MDCRDARDLFSPMVDDELPSGDRFALEAHLAGCADCAERVRALRALDEALLAAPRIAAPPAPAMLRAIEARLAADVEVAATREARPRPLPVPLPAGWTRWAPSHSAAATVAAALLSLLGVVEVASWLGRPPAPATARHEPARVAVRAPRAEIASAATIVEPPASPAAPRDLAPLAEALLAAANEVHIERTPELVAEHPGALVPPPAPASEPALASEPELVASPAPGETAPAAAATEVAARPEGSPRLGLYPLVSANDDDALTPTRGAVARAALADAALLALASPRGDSGATLRLTPDAGLDPHRDALAAAAGLGMPSLVIAFAALDLPAAPDASGLAAREQPPARRGALPALAVEIALREPTGATRDAPARLLPRIPLLDAAAFAVRDEELAARRSIAPAVDGDRAAPVLAVALLF